MARQTQKQKVASLINTILVAREMLHDTKNVDAWYESECKAYVDLADKHGIKLPALDVKRERLEYYKMKRGY